MNPLVKTELCNRWKSLPTLLTLVGLLTYMQLLMVTELGGRMEPFPTFPTLMRLLTTVSTLRFRNIRTTNKDTFLIFAAFFAVMKSLMHD